MIDTHMDGFHRTSRRSEAPRLIALMRETFVMKASEPFGVALSEHLKQDRWKLNTCTFVQGDGNLTGSLMKLLGLENAKPA